MTADRTIPVAAEQREFIVKVNGELLSRQAHLLAVVVTHSANKLSRAKLVYQDGAAASSDFPLSNSDSFLPGNSVEILAGAAGEEESLFTGVVIKHSLKIREHVAPQLVIDCRHKAVSMTATAKFKYFLEQTDSDAIRRIADDYDITGDIESSDLTHKQLLQYGVSDWDFCLLRAAVNGQLVFCEADKITTKKPEVSAGEELVLQFGSSILELDAELDARHQHNSIKALRWDAATQEVVELDATDPGMSSPGNVAAADLANAIYDKATVVALDAGDDSESQVYIDNLWAISQLNQVGARVKCEGMTAVKPGMVVTLDGVGERFSGNAYVTGVRHDFDLVKGWKTSIQIGGVKQVYEQTLLGLGQSTSAQPNAVGGLTAGVVLSNEDPSGEFRIKISLPMLGLGEEGIWARLSSLDAGERRGMVFRPEIGDEVVVGFFDDDPRAPVILGMMHSSAKPAPLEGADDNHEKVFLSRSEMKMSFDDDQIILSFETPAGNRIVLDEAQGGIFISDQNSNVLAMSSDGISIESAGEIRLSAGSKITTKSELETQCEAGTQLTLEGTAGVGVSSSAITEIKGSMVQIN